jgi:hypothetical protein
MNNSSVYKVISNDSLSFPAFGSFLGSTIDGQIGGATGAKYVLNGNTLVMTSLVSNTVPSGYNGLSGTNTTTGKFIITFQKQ